MENKSLITTKSDWGVGILHKNHIVYSFVKGSPAFYSPLISGDIVYSVDNNFLDDEDTLDLSGKYNSYTKIKVLREKSIIKVKLKRTMYIKKKWLKTDFVYKN
mgnify:CR=1 FL=1|tara:strand:- start:141 stop:449 length:309 start_codon:yes stop_codon:yes gene_type:complete